SAPPYTLSLHDALPISNPACTHRRLAYFAASMLHLLQGDWVNARSRIEKWIAMLQTGNVAIHLPWAVASSAWALAQIGEDGLRRSEEHTSELQSPCNLV